MSAGGGHLLPDQARGGGQETQLGVQGRDSEGGAGAPPARPLRHQAQVTVNHSVKSVLSGIMLFTHATCLMP